MIAQSTEWRGQPGVQAFFLKSDYDLNHFYPERADECEKTGSVTLSPQSMWCLCSPSCSSSSFFSLFLLSQEQTQHNNKKKRERETSNSNDEVTVSRGLGGDKSRRKCTLRLVE